jgi:hypothetical protein
MPDAVTPLAAVVVVAADAVVAVVAGAAVVAVAAGAVVVPGAVVLDELLPHAARTAKSELTATVARVRCR